jgi:hypothetical protein
MCLMFFDAELDGASCLSDVNLGHIHRGVFYIPGVLNPGASFVGGM